MARDPFKVDQLQIEPGSAGTRLVRRASDGSLEFVDARVTGGITLSQLAGLKAVQNVLVVGKAGAGAGYTTIQSALDAIPASSSPTNPYFVLVGPGVYRETLNIVRSGVHLVGFGATLQSEQEATPNGVGAYHTMVIMAALGTIPTEVTLTGLTITNAHDNYACIRALGGAASTVGSVGIQVTNCRLDATAPGGNYTIWATAMNILRVQGGAMEDPTGLAQVRIEECAEVTLQGLDGAPALSFRWDALETLPNNAHTAYFVSGCLDVGTLSSLTPKIDMFSQVAPDQGLLLLSGLQGRVPPSASVTGGVCRAHGCDLGAVTVTTAQALLSNCHTTSQVAAGGGFIAREVSSGSVALVAEATKAVTFGARAPSTTYRVSLELDGVAASSWWITNKTVTGFTINFAAPETLGVNWVVNHDD